jgi:hypothetical protein
MGDGTKRIQSDDKKVKTIRNLLDKISSQEPFVNKRSHALLAKLCVFCENPNLNFLDELSKKEYKLSGMCQTCQDNYFKEF